MINASSINFYFVFFTFAQSFLFSQTTLHFPKSQFSQQFWDNERLISINPVGHTITIERVGQPIKRLTASWDHATWGWGRFIALDLLNGLESTPPHVAVMESDDGIHWNQLGTLDPEEHGFPMYLYESEKPGLFLASNTITGFNLEGRFSFFSWWERDQDGKFSLKSLLNFEFDGPLFLPFAQIEKSHFQQLVLPPKLQILPFLDFPIPCSSGFLMMSIRVGMGWYFKTGSTSPDKKFNLSGATLKDIHPSWRLSRAILGIQPTKENKVLIAHRSAEAVLHAREAFIDSPTEPRGADDRSRIILEQERALRTHPEIIWSEFDPTTGKVEEAIRPGLEYEIKSMDHANQLYFTFLPDGSVSTGHAPWKIKSGAAPQKSPAKP